MINIAYPFIHKLGEIEYVSEDNQYIIEAKKFALANSLDENVPTGTVIVKNGKIIGKGSNGSDFHKKHGCERIRLNIPTGKQYELCEGCHPKNHSESRAVADALNSGRKTQGAEAYLWGHWWCCEPCWNSLINAGINKVFLLQNSEILFNKTSKLNILKKPSLSR